MQKQPATQFSSHSCRGIFLEAHEIGQDGPHEEYSLKLSEQRPCESINSSVHCDCTTHGDLGLLPFRINPEKSKCKDHETLIRGI